jgi:hypothetical protein
MLLTAVLALAASTATLEPKFAPAGSSPALVGLSAKDLRARLGEPDVANGEGAGALWTYRLPDCAVLVFLEDKGRGLKVAGAEAGPRRRGEAVPGLETCLAGVEKP